MLCAAGYQEDAMVEQFRIMIEIFIIGMCFRNQKGRKEMNIQTERY